MTNKFLRAGLISLIMTGLQLQARIYHESVDRVWGLFAYDRKISELYRDFPADALIVTGVDGDFGEREQEVLEEAAREYDAGVASRIFVFSQPDWNDSGEQARTYLRKQIRRPGEADIEVLGPQKDTVAKIRKLVEISPRYGLRSLRLVALPDHGEFETQMALNHGFIASAHEVESTESLSPLKILELGLSGCVDPRGWIFMAGAEILR